MIAVFVNMLTVLAGSTIGLIFRNKIKERYTESLIAALALCTFVIGIMSAIGTNDILIVIICIVIGTAIGELIRLDDRIEGAGDFFQRKLFKGKSTGGRFSEGFVSACILFCIGSMTIMGSIEAGVNGNNSVIFAKSALDFVSSMAFAAAMGVGVPFSAVFILLYQGGLTLLAGVVAPYLSDSIVAEMSAIGGAILIGMAINMLNLAPKRIRVANMLPAIFMPVLYFPVADLISGLFK